MLLRFRNCVDFHYNCIQFLASTSSSYVKFVLALSQFKDMTNLHDIFYSLAINDDIKGFEALWKNTESDSHSLFRQNDKNIPDNHAIMVIMTTPNGKIRDYLLLNYNHYLTDIAFTSFAAHINGILKSRVNCIYSSIDAIDFVK